MYRGARIGQADAVTFRWSSPEDYLTADPHARNEGLPNNINDHVYERLTVRDKKLDILPALAESWNKANDLSWRFDLRKVVKFHDGTPLTLEDVVFSAVLGPENRVIFLGMDQGREQLDHSNIKGRSPFKDVRVRRAS